MHDPRLGRFLSIDPLSPKYPFYSPYTFSGNRVIDAIEFEGLEPLKKYMNAYAGNLITAVQDFDIVDYLGNTQFLIGVGVSIDLRGGWPGLLNDAKKESVGLIMDGYGNFAVYSTQGESLSFLGELYGGNGTEESGSATAGVSLGFTGDLTIMTHADYTHVQDYQGIFRDQNFLVGYVAAVDIGAVKDENENILGYSMSGGLGIGMSMALNRTNTVVMAFTKKDIELAVERSLSHYGMIKDLDENGSYYVTIPSSYENLDGSIDIVLETYQVANPLHLQVANGDSYEFVGSTILVSFKKVSDDYYTTTNVVEKPKKQ
jgi:hypothetical protein